MLRSISIDNFRCYKRLQIDNCARFNLIVGDNGAGKTALLEALFLALSGSVEVGLRLRSHRGFEQTYGGSPQVIEEAMWRDYFYENDWSKTISIRLQGSGPEARALTIQRGEKDLLIASASAESGILQSALSPLKFTWINSVDKEYVVQPTITPQGIQVPSTGEMLPGFSLFPANQTVSATETATGFSALSREGNEDQFVSLFVKEFPFISDLSIEVVGGLPVVHATMAGTRKKDLSTPFLAASIVL